MFNTFQKKNKVSSKLFRLFRASVFGLGAGISFAAFSVANAASCTGNECILGAVSPNDYNYNTISGSYGSGSVIVNSGATTNIVGGLSLGDFGDAILSLLSGDAAYKAGYLTSTNSGFDISDYNTIVFSAKTGGVTIVDPVTGSQTVVAAYNAHDISVNDALDWSAGPSIYYIKLGTGPVDGYLNTTLVAANGVGATANINITGNVDQKTFGIKQSVLFQANNGGLVNWQSRNDFSLSSPASTSGATPPGTLSYSLNNFVGAFTPNYTKDGVSYNLVSQNVTDLVSLQAYNEYLKVQLSNGVLGDTVAEAGKNYNSLLAQAYSSINMDFIYDPYNGAWPPAGDYINQDQGIMAIVGASGAGSEVHILSGARLGWIFPDAGNLIHISDNGKVINDGEIYSQIWAGGNSTIDIESGGEFINNGVRTVVGGAAGDDITGNSKYTNSATGILNIGLSNATTTNSARNDIFLTVYNGAIFENAGNANIGTNAAGASRNDVKLAVAYDYSTVMNAAGGVAYIGREANATGTVADVSKDVVIRDRAVALSTNGVYATAINNGTIIIGSKVQNSIAMEAIATGTNYATLRNNGLIRIDGMYNDAPQANYGIYATGGATIDVENTANGVIELNGTNATAIFAGEGASAKSAGLIIVGGTSSKGGLNNYGAVASGSGSEIEVSGIIKLTGTGAIGVVAYDGGLIDIQGGQIVFDANDLSSTGQIGYLVSGATSNIQSGSATQNVTADQSVLIRIQDGARYNGAATTAARDVVTASGESSVAYYVSGAGQNWSASNPQFKSGNILFGVTGLNAQGIFIDGGSYGILDGKTSSSSDGAVFTLVQQGSTGVVIDGWAHDLAGERTGTGPLATTLDSSATINITADGIGYIAQYGGTLNLSGSISILGLEGNGVGVRLNEGTANMLSGSSIITKGIGVDVIGTSSVLNMQSGGNITAQGIGNMGSAGKAAAIRLSNGGQLNITGSSDIIGMDGAHGILLDNGASSLTFGNSSADTGWIRVSGGGRGIENAAETSGFALQNVRIEVSGDNSVGIRTATTLATDNAGQVVVNGNNGIGLLFEKADGSMATDMLDLSNSADLIFTVAGKDAIGIKTNASTPILNTGASVNVTAADGGSALVVDGLTTTINNSGNLISSSTTRDLITIGTSVSTLTNTGKLQAATGTVLATSNNNFVFTNEKTGIASGLVQLSGLNNTVNLKDKSQTGTVEGGNGGTTFNLVDLDETLGGTFIQLKGGTADDNVIMSGQSILTLDTSKTYLSSFDKINNFTVNAGSVLNLNDQNLLLGNANDNAAGLLTINDTGKVNVTQTGGDYIFENTLAGDGSLVFDLTTPSNSLSFSNQVGSAFTGSVEIKNANFVMGGWDINDNVSLQSKTNSETLRNATLVAGAHSNIIIRNNFNANNDALLGGLVFNGGTVDFGLVSPDRSGLYAQGHVSGLNSLDISKNGNISFNFDNILTQAAAPVPPVGSKAVSLFDQDETEIYAILAQVKEGGNVIGSGAGLTVNSTGLLDLSDYTVANVGIEQYGVVTAVGTYRYRATSKDANGISNGLYITYGLDELEIQDGQTFILNKTTLTKDTDLSTKITDQGQTGTGLGTGKLQIGLSGEAQSAVLTLSNTLNDYTGATNVTGKTTLGMRADNVLGYTEALNINEQAGFNANGFTQREIAALSMTNDTLLRLAGGHMSFGNANLVGATVMVDNGSFDITSSLDAQNGNFVLNGGNLNFAANSVNNFNQTTLYDNGIAATINLGSAATLNVKGANAGLSANTQINIGGAAVVTLDNVQGLGNSIINFANTDSILNVAMQGARGSGSIQNKLVGSGLVNFSNSDVSLGLAEAILTNDNSQFDGKFAIKTDTRLTVTNASQLGNANIEVVSGGFFNINTDHDWTFNHNLEGNGTLEKNGSGKLILALDKNNTAGFTGHIDIYNGILEVERDFSNSTIGVFNGAQLSGMGKVGTTILHAGGALAPGDGETYYGTFGVAGDLTFESGSYYNLYMTGSPVQSTLVQVDGKAYLNSGAYVDATRANMAYVSGTKWTILRAQNGVEGIFNPTIYRDEAPYIDMSLGYDLNNVYITFTKKDDVSYCLPGMTGNQCNTGNGLDGHNNDLTDAIDGLTAGEAAQAFNSLSGEGYATSRAMMIEDSRYIRDAMNRRLRVAGTLADDAHNGWWLQGLGAWGKMNAHGSAMKIKRGLGGVLGGYDGIINDDIRFGILAGYTNSDMKLNSGRNTEIKVDSYHIGAYLGKNINQWQLRAGAAYTYNSLDSDRNVFISGKHSKGYRDKLSGDYHASTFQVFGEAAYDYIINAKWQAQPYLNLAYVHLDTDGLTEDGNYARLKVGGKKDDVFFSTLGLRGKYTTTLSNGTLIGITGGIGWRHTAGNIDMKTHNRFATSGSPFTIQGLSLDKNGLLLEFGIDAKVTENMTFGISYSGFLGNHYKDNAVKANFSWKF